MFQKGGLYTEASESERKKTRRSRRGVNSAKLIHHGDDLEIYSKSNRKPLERFSCHDKFDLLNRLR